MLYQTTNPHGGDIYNETEKILLDFSANTNPFGTPPAVLEAMRAALADVHRYPDPFCRKLVQAIAAHEGVPAEYILCGNGAAELIYAYCWATRPQSALLPAPTFAEYELALEQVGCKTGHWLLQQKRNFDLTETFVEELECRSPQAVFLCNPNNPTGRLIDPDLLQKILHSCRSRNILLFVDECFLDLAKQGSSLKPFLKDNPQLFLLKAFTKSYGMAGVRLGYCLSANRELLGKMAAVVQPWNVSLPAQAAGVAALAQTDFLRQTRVLIHTQRPWLQGQLQDLGFWVCPSAANYLLFCGRPGLEQALRARGIALRSCANYAGLGQGWYRTAVRLPEQNRQLIEAIRQLREGKETPWPKTL